MEYPLKWSETTRGKGLQSRQTQRYRKTQDLRRGPPATMSRPVASRGKSWSNRGSLIPASKERRPVRPAESGGSWDVKSGKGSDINTNQLASLKKIRIYELLFVPFGEGVRVRSACYTGKGNSIRDLETPFGLLSHWVRVGTSINVSTWC